MVSLLFVCRVRLKRQVTDNREKRAGVVFSHLPSSLFSLPSSLCSPSLSSHAHTEHTSSLARVGGLALRNKNTRQADRQNWLAGWLPRKAGQSRAEQGRGVSRPSPLLPSRPLAILTAARRSPCVRACRSTRPQPATAPRTRGRQPPPRPRPPPQLLQTGPQQTQWQHLGSTRRG